MPRSPEDKLRDAKQRAQLEALQFLEGEIRDSTSNGEWLKTVLQQDRVQAAFERRRQEAANSLQSRSPSAYDLLRSRPALRPASSAASLSAQHAGEEAFPPAITPPDRLGFGTRDSFGTIKPTRPLTVKSVNNALYLTSANSISFPGRKFGRASSFATLPSVSSVSLHSASTLGGTLGGPSTFKQEDPVRNSYTLGFNFKEPAISEVVEARWTPTTWGVYNTAPMRPSLRAALQGMDADDKRWKHGSWVPRGRVATPRSESMARFR